MTNDSNTQNWSLDGEFHLWWTMEGDQSLWRERFGSLMHLADNPILILSSEGTILEINHAAETHFKVSRDDVRGVCFLKELLRVPSVAGLQPLEERIRGYETASTVGEVLSRKALKRYIRWDTVKIVDQAKQVIGVIAYGSDITHEHEVELQLKRVLRELEDEKNAIDQAAIVAITDVKGNITYANNKFCELSQYSQEELLGQNHRIVNSGYHPQEFFKELWNTISSGQIWKGEIRNRAKDGSFYWVYTTIVPFLDEDNRPYRYVSIRTDVTDKKNAQKQIDEERSRAVYAERLASLGEMAAGVAHELGTPLATIRGRMELLELQLDKGDVDQQRLRALATTVKEQADRMTGIIRGILSSARDGSRDPFRPTPVKEMVNNILDYSTEKFRRYGIDVECEIPESLIIECRETQVAQVLLNLLSNAADAIRNLPEKWIKVQALQKGKEAQISVTDSGSGIPVELEQKIMEPFYTTKEVGKGTGLGLSISKNLIAQHGGRLAIDRECENTRFLITLPMCQPEG